MKKVLMLLSLVCIMSCSEDEFTQDNLNYEQTLEEQKIKINTVNYQDLKSNKKN